jgi:hypothetical protein
MQAPGIATPEKFATVVPIAVEASDADTSEHASTDAICWAFVGEGEGDSFGELAAVDDDDELPHAAASSATVASANARANMVEAVVSQLAQMGVK